MADKKNPKDLEDEDALDKKAESDGEDGEEGEGEGQAARGFNKKLLFIIVPVLLLAIGGGLYVSGILNPLLGIEEEAGAEGGEHAGEEGAAAETTSAFYALPDIIVNLASDSGPRFLKLRVQLELEKAEDLPAIEIVAPRVIDQFQTYLREMRVEDLRGSAGIYRLRQELLYRVNLAAHPIKVKDVLFQEMLIQ